MESWGFIQQRTVLQILLQYYVLLSMSLDNFLKIENGNANTNTNCEVTWLPCEIRGNERLDVD